MKPRLYGIPNCDTVKKARAWLAEHRVEYEFHDYKKLGIDTTRLDAWFAQVDWQQLLNRSGTTWRKLDEAHKAAITTAATAAALMRAQPSVIRRPVIETDTGLLVGFDAQRYTEHFK